MVGLCRGGYYLIRSYNVVYDLGLEALKKLLKQQSINVNIAAQNLKKVLDKSNFIWYNPE